MFSEQWSLLKLWSTGHKKKVIQEDMRIFFFFSLSKCHLRSSFTRLLHLHETRNVHENLSVYVCVRVLVRACLRTYVRGAAT